jgi:hypothetical protein
MGTYRREGPRIDVEAMCWELIDGREAGALAVDLSAGGVCIERPYTGGKTPRDVPLQLEVPGIDEVMWARGETTFDVVVPGTSPTGLVRRTGYRIVAAARRDLRLIEDFVRETHRATVDAMIDRALVSCYGYPRA